MAEVPLEKLLPTPAPPAIPEKQLIQLTSSPDGAAVFRGNEAIGVTPIEIEMAADAQPQLLKFKRAGYISTERTVSADAGEVIVELRKKPSSKRRIPKRSSTKRKQKTTSQGAPKKQKKMDVW